MQQPPQLRKRRDKPSKFCSLILRNAISRFYCFTYVRPSSYHPSLLNCAIVVHVFFGRLLCLPLLRVKNAYFCAVALLLSAKKELENRLGSVRIMLENLGTLLSCVRFIRFVGICRLQVLLEHSVVFNPTAFFGGLQ